MTKYTPEEIKNRLSNIGEAIGTIALEYIIELEKENEQLKARFEKLLDFVVDRTEECDVCELTDTCINSEGVCPFAWSNRNIKDLIIKYIDAQKQP